VRESLQHVAIILHRACQWFLTRAIGMLIAHRATAPTASTRATQCFIRRVMVTSSFPHEIPWSLSKRRGC